MKKMFILGLISLSVLVIAGCRKDGDDRIKIHVGMWPEPYLSDDVAMYNEWKRLFEADYPQYEIIPKPYSYSLDTFFPMAQAGTQPTIFQTWFTEPEKLIRNGFVRDITTQLVELGWDEKMDVQMRETLTFDGKIYGVPRDGYGLGLYINLEIFEMVGLIDDHDGDGILDIVNPDGTPRYPTTFEELADMSEFISDTMQDIYGQSVAGLIVLSTNNNGGWQFSNIAWNFGAELQKQNQDGQWVANLNDPAAVEALEWIKDMKWNRGALPESGSLSYADWFNYIGTGRAAMAIAGNDAISLPITNFGMDKEKVAFVPMPAGPRGHQYSLFGGTPFMFSAHASDEQVLGALKFLEYIGHFPETSDISIQSIRLGMRVADDKGMPILPNINPWINEDYLHQLNLIYDQFVNVQMSNFQDFYETIYMMRRPEVPYYSQEMYEILDSVIQQVLTNQHANPSALLSSANNTFQTQYMNRVNNG